MHSSQVSKTERMGSEVSGVLFNYVLRRKNNEKGGFKKKRAYLDFGFQQKYFSAGTLQKHQHRPSHLHENRLAVSQSTSVCTTIRAYKANSKLNQYQCILNLLCVYTCSMTESLQTHDNARYLQSVSLYLHASVTFNFSFLYRGMSSAHKEEVGKQGLIFVGELL